MSSSPFLQSVSDHMAVRRYSPRTIKAYRHWIKRFIIFQNKQHPESLGRDDVVAFLTHLAVDRHVSPGTQALPVNALVYLFNSFLGRELGDVSAFRRSERQPTLPVVLTETEVQQLGHSDVKTTEIYTHVLKQGAQGVRSPLSRVLGG